MKNPLIHYSMRTLLLLGALSLPVQAVHAAPPVRAVKMAQPAMPDPAMQAVLDAQQSLGLKPIETLTPAKARKQPTVSMGVMKVLKQNGMSIKPEPVADVNKITIAEGNTKTKAMVYTPAGTGPFPVIVYYHGGGFVIGNLLVYDASPRALANAAGAIVISAEYRKGPEARYPAAHEDAFNAYVWALKNAAALGGDPAKVAVAGESAGGNLAGNGFRALNSRLWLRAES